MRQVRLTRRGKAFAVAALVLLVAAPVLSLPALLSAFALVTGLVGCAVVYVLLGQSGLTVRRTFDPDVVPHGGTVTATLVVDNLSGWPTVAARWNDTVPTAVGADASGVLPGLGGRHARTARSTLTYAVQGRRRGLHRLGPLRVETLDPFGLARREREVGDVQEVLVLPRSERLDRSAAPAVDDEGAAHAAPHLAGLGEDDVVARPYLPGDALKRMHWKATAHRGEPMVRQEEQWADPRAGLVLDTHDASFGTAHEGGEWSYSPELEWAVTAAASIATHLVGAGYAVTTRSVGGGVDRELVEADGLRDTLVDLAVVEPTSGPLPASAEVDPGERTVLAVLGRLDVERAAAWAGALASAHRVSALVLASTRPEALDVLERAGWRVGTYSAQDDVAQAWSGLQRRGEVAAGAEG